MSSKPYEQVAWVYDAIYAQMKDYPGEAEELRRLIAEFNRSGATSLLDVACGTGLHALELGKWYEVDGLDLSAAQLAIARQRLPLRTTLHQADMRTFDLPGRYGAITCMFSAIGYLLKYADLVTTFTNVYQHLLPGGIFIVEPWLAPGAYMPGRLHENIVQEPGLYGRRIVRIATSERSGNLIRLHLQHFVRHNAEAWPGRWQTSQFTEIHELMMYPHVVIIQALETAGLEVRRYDKYGVSGNSRGLYVARRPLQ